MGAEGQGCLEGWGWGGAGGGACPGGERGFLPLSGHSPPCCRGSQQPLGLAGDLFSIGADVRLRHSAVRLSGLVPAGGPWSAVLETGPWQESAFLDAPSPTLGATARSCVDCRPSRGGPAQPGTFFLTPGRAHVASPSRAPAQAGPPAAPVCPAGWPGRWGVALQALPGYPSFWNLFRSLPLFIHLSVRAGREVRSTCSPAR